MHIMTRDGWRLIHQPNLIEMSQNDGRYRGPLPSNEMKAAIRLIQDDITASRKMRGVL